jgi:hypothetical protein
MKFEEQFPELKEGRFHYYPDDGYVGLENSPDVRPVYNASGNYTKEYGVQHKYSQSKFWLQPEDIQEHCLSKQRVKEAINKVTQHEPNKLIIVTDFLKELGL